MKKSCGAILFFIFITGAFAYASKELFWNNIEVDAVLKNDGSLDITEIQTFNFTGDYNGGFREFALLQGQSLDFTRLERLSDGKWMPVVGGDINQVDRYTFEGKTLVKWRSRLVSDLPFDRTKITYKLHYKIKGEILVKAGNEYILDYDFLFPKRDGIVENYRLRLQYEDLWKPAADFQSTYSASNLQPGKSFVVKKNFFYLGNDRQINARKILSETQKNTIKISFLGFVVFLVFFFIIVEIKRGRLRPLPSPKIVDQAFLKKYIFDLEPEEVGALWDGQIGSAEVAAILAKHIANGNLRSEWTTRKFLGILTRKEVQLELLTSLEKIKEDEDRNLLKKMFPKGKITSKEIIFKYYSTHNEGFDPSNEIRKPIEKKFAGMPELSGKDVKAPYWILSPVWIIASLYLAGTESYYADPENFFRIYGSVILLSLVPALFVYFLSSNLRYRIESPWVILLRLGVRLLVPAVCFLSFVGLFELRFYGYIAAFLGASSFLTLFTTISLTRNHRQKLDFRRNIVMARNYLKNELKKKNPNLADEAIPYLIALELAPHLDRWSKFANTTTTTESMDHGTMAASRSGASMDGSFSGGIDRGFTGGGGSFGGAGATGSWTAAAISLGAVSVSDSSSSSGDGGGSSGGGGGGGGW